MNKEFKKTLTKATRPKKKKPYVSPKRVETHSNFGGVTITKTSTITLTATQVREAIDDLKKLYGMPPYDSGNPCRWDGIYSRSLETKYNLTLSELVKAVKFNEIEAKWEQLKRSL